MSHSQNNQPEGDHRSDGSESQANRAEAKAENRERGEASKLIADGDLNKDIQANTLEKRLSRKSGATGYGVASADSLLPTEAEIQQLGKQLTEKTKPEKPLAVIAQSLGDTNPLIPQTNQVVSDATNATGTGDVIAQGFNIPNPVDAYKREIEHKYRGRELETMNRDIPAKAWAEAYKAFPELQQIGEKDAIKLMKAIIANELDHYGPLDITQDQLAKTGHGGGLHEQTLGYSQIKPDAIREQALVWNKQLTDGKRTANPLKQFEHMSNDGLALALEDPKQAPLFVASNLALNLQMLNRHSKECSSSAEALGYMFNPDMYFAKADKQHQHALTRKEAAKLHSPHSFALPTPDVLHKSAHAQNIRNWLKKVD